MKMLHFKRRVKKWGYAFNALRSDRTPCSCMFCQPDRYKKELPHRDKKRVAELEAPDGWYKETVWNQYELNNAARLCDPGNDDWLDDLRIKLMIEKGIDWRYGI